MTRNAFVTCRNMYRLKSVMTRFPNVPRLALSPVPLTPENGANWLVAK
jgi:hypothetical protein